jgi:stage III sporulation protein AE
MKKWVITTIIIFIICIPNIARSASEETLNQNQIKEELEKGVEEQINALDTSDWDEFLKSAQAEGNQLIENTNAKDFIRKLVTGNFEFDLKKMLQQIAGLFFKEIKVNLIFMVKIMVVAVICGIVDHMKANFTDSSISELAWFACYMIVIILVVQSFTNILEVGKDAMEQMVNFVRILFPVLLTLLIAMGGVTSSAILKPTTAMLVGMAGNLLKNIMLPLIFFSAMLVLINHTSEKIRLDRLCNLVKNLCTWTLGIFFTIFVGVLTVQGVLAASFDGVSIRTAKYAIETFVPIVGSLFSKTVDMVVGGSLLVKNAVGMAGLIITVMIAFYPAIKILCLITVYKLSSALLEPISDSKVSDCLNDIGNVLTVLFVTVVGVAIMFFLTITLLIGASNITTMMR